VICARVYIPSVCCADVLGGKVVSEGIHIIRIYSATIHLKCD